MGDTHLVIKLNPGGGKQGRIKVKETRWEEYKNSRITFIFVDKRVRTNKKQSKVIMEVQE